LLVISYVLYLIARARSATTNRLKRPRSAVREIVLVGNTGAGFYVAIIEPEVYGNIRQVFAGIVYSSSVDMTVAILGVEFGIIYLYANESVA